MKRHDRPWAAGERPGNDGRAAIAVVVLAAALIVFVIVQLV